MTADAAHVIAPAKPATDPRFDRVPMERTAMILVVPHTGKKADRLSIVETTTGGRVVLESGDSVFEREMDPNVRELRALASFANTIARRVARRPEWKP